MMSKAANQRGRAELPAFLPGTQDKPVPHLEMLRLVDSLPALAKRPEDFHNVSGLAEVFGCSRKKVYRALKTDDYVDGRYGLREGLQNLKNATLSKRERSDALLRDQLAEAKTKIGKQEKIIAALRYECLLAHGLDPRVQVERTEQLEPDELAAKRATKSSGASTDADGEY